MIAVHFRTRHLPYPPPLLQHLLSTIINDYLHRKHFNLLQFSLLPLRIRAIPRDATTLRGQARGMSNRNSRIEGAEIGRVLSQCGGDAYSLAKAKRIKIPRVRTSLPSHLCWTKTAREDGCVCVASPSQDSRTERGIPKTRQVVHWRRADIKSEAQGQIRDLFANIAIRCSRDMTPWIAIRETEERVQVLPD